MEWFVVAGLAGALALVVLVTHGLVVRYIHVSRQGSANTLELERQ